MKVNNSQIAKAINNTYKFNVDGPVELYNAIRANTDKAIINADIHKTDHHFTKADWNKVYREIKKLIK